MVFYSEFCKISDSIQISEAAIRGGFAKWLLLKISQNKEKNNCREVSL